MSIFGKLDPTIIPLDLSENQFEIYNKIARNYSHTFLFESLTGPEELAETSIMGFDPDILVKGYFDKVEIINKSGKTKTIKTKDPFDVIKNILHKTNLQTYRYLGGAVGFVNYDAIRIWEKIPQRYDVQQPIMEFGIYYDGLLYDNKEKKLYYFYYNKDRSGDLKITKNEFSQFEIGDVTSNLNEQEFSDMVEKAKKYIEQGDVFQVVLSRKFSFEGKGDHLNIYRVLRNLNPSPYLYHMKLNERTVIGASPEMLVRITDRIVETFPIAGTRKITSDEKENEKMKEELKRDEKELAEHTMLVDLGRNDIGRVCKYGTVRMNSLMEVKRFSHVQHMVSHVIGDLDQKYDMIDAFKAVFPAGTVSGAPKVRAMEIIDELEPESRGAYSGAVGYFSFNGCCDFAIAIRSIFLTKNGGFVQAGAGIVSDSIPHNEFKETEHKAEGMIQALKEAGN
ncbi:MAG: anthranilate synthase component I [Nitrosopumilaceae archaeon]|nr:anthranilate synthase component I family protein [Nitrosopumilaceae archaeon]NIU02621.1 anthranilate synthase component I family protein [Nitrosopumilaceae archaeon]NIU89084.1 anthranilate synthase component I [Nitrosopumilaceae archaeon]NIV67187.1 anthranilate synthase component I [Nitrosopumilaceae archaeon]NIX63222.1 anthranilate synthase component I [Nitrosopumilaceae archaeon]